MKPQLEGTGNGRPPQLTRDALFFSSAHPVFKGPRAVWFRFDWKAEARRWESRVPASATRAGTSSSERASGRRLSPGATQVQFPTVVQLRTLAMGFVQPSISLVERLWPRAEGGQRMRARALQVESWWSRCHQDVSHSMEAALGRQPEKSWQARRGTQTLQGEPAASGLVSEQGRSRREPCCLSQQEDTRQPAAIGRATGWRENKTSNAPQRHWLAAAAAAAARRTRCLAKPRRMLQVRDAGQPGTLLVGGLLPWLPRRSVNHGRGGGGCPCLAL